MRIPPIKEGQIIGIVVPARKVNEAKLLQGCEVIKSWGLQVKLGKHCCSEANEYLAASDEARLADLQRMLDSRLIDAIFCARGGYGTTRILDQLDFTEFVKKPKWIVGFSDITALHLKLHQLGIESIHGFMPTQFSNPAYEESLRSLKEILFTDKKDIIAAKVNGKNRSGIGTGTIIGGNLSLVVDSLATSTEPNTNGKILVLEEIDEPFYKIDRMFMQLKRAGKLSSLAGLIIGHMTDIKDTELPFNQSIEEIVMNKVWDYSYPVAFDFPIGHAAPNLAWKYSAMATLTATNVKSELIFE